LAIEDPQKDGQPVNLAAMVAKAILGPGVTPHRALSAAV
jgi:hypothetical protein